MNRRIFEMISNFAKKHAVDITFKFDSIGDLIIIMTRDEYSIDRKIGCCDLTWLEDCDNVILAQLYSMINNISC